jgi:thiamine biosynthesis lipoprotein
MVILFNTYRSLKSGTNSYPPGWIGSILMFLCLAPCLWFGGCTKQDTPKVPILTKLSGNALGTTWMVQVLTDKTFEKVKLQKDIVQNLEAADKIFSHWRPDSELFQFNANPTTNDTVVHPQLHNLLKHAQWMHRETDGAFDPTLGALVNLWGFGPEGKTRSSVPTEQQIEDVQKIIGLENLEISQNGNIRKKVSALQLDLSGSAKGEIIDQICNLLDRLNFHNFLVEIGGEVRAQGKGRNGNGWIVGLETGGSREIDLISVPLRNYAVATSGTYRLKKTNPNSTRNASHLLNPKTGYPVVHNLIAVNTFAPTARDADAWATALMIMGLEKGMQQAEEMDLVARFCELKDGITCIYSSTSYQRLFSAKNNL